MPTTETFVLPDSVRPSKYHLTLQPDLQQFTFRGQVAIDIEVIKRTSEIVLNADELQIESATLAGVSRSIGTPLPARHVTTDQTHQTLTLDFGRPIAIGNARLDIKFTGQLNDKLRGFYRSQYTTPEGEQRYLAATQFEATDARRAFPCWDEPACKAKFEVTLVIPGDLVAVSNTPVVSETPLSPPDPPESPLTEGGLRGVSLTIGVLETATKSEGMTSVTSNLALHAGSSQQGKARRASVASNWVAARYRCSPSGDVY